MLKKRNKSALPEKVAVASDLTKDEVYAILKTLVEDKDDALILKLEIRLKASGKYRVLARVSKTAN